MVAPEARGVDPVAQAGSTRADTRGARSGTGSRGTRSGSGTRVTGPGPRARAEARSAPG